MKATISQMFDYFPGNHGLTEEVIYNSQPTRDDDCVPIFSGSKNNIIPIGVIRRLAKNKAGADIKCFEGPCLILTKDGSAGLMTFKEEGIFTINHHACVLRIKDEWKDRLDQEWFAYQHETGLLQFVTSKSDNRILSTQWFDRILFDVPDYEVQWEQKIKKRELNNLIACLNRVEEGLRQTATGSVLDFGKGEISKLKDIFHFRGGNSGLTEKFIYSNQPSEDSDGIPIFSSATLKANMMGEISRTAKPGGRRLKLFKGPSILVARNGYAGIMTYIEEDEFTTNDHAYVLSPKKEWEDRINQRWFIHQYQGLFYTLVTSKSDNATFNKYYAEKQEVRIPDKESFQDMVAGRLLRIDNIVTHLEGLKEQIEDLLECEII